MRGVPDDEAEEVRALLDENEIEFFETHAGNWGISMPALWVKKDDEWTRARDLLDGYQRQRSQRMREEYQLMKARGEARTLWLVFREDPLRFIALSGLALAVLVLSGRFFISF